MNPHKLLIQYSFYTNVLCKNCNGFLYHILLWQSFIRNHNQCIWYLKHCIYI